MAGKNVSLSFPDQTYTSANKPSTTTLKTDLSSLETQHNAVDNAMIEKDGSVAFTGNQSMGSNKLTNVAAGTGAADVATIGGTETLTSKTLTNPTVTTGSFTDPGITNNSRAEARLNASVDTAVTQDVQKDFTATFDTEEADPNSNFASSTYTVPVTGQYLVTWCLNLSTVGAGVLDAALSSLFVNGSERRRGAQLNASTSSASTIGLPGSTIISLTAGDTITVGATVIVDANDTVRQIASTGTAAAQHFSIQLLSQ